MNLSQVSDTLTRLFSEHRLVFWNDAKGEFEEAVGALALDGVEVLRTDREPALALKWRLEQESPEGKFLLYAAAPEPAQEEDWLLDVRLYSQSFHADRASILLDELGLSHQSLRAHLEAREAFFNAKDRVERLKRFVTPDDLGPEIDMKMLAVLTRAEQPEFFQILMKLLADWGKDTQDLSQPPTAWAEIEKFGLAGFFWEEIGRRFEYHKEAPAFENWLLHMLVTDLARTVKEPLPQQLSHFVLPGRPVNVSVFLAQWRAHAHQAPAYARLSGVVAEKLQLAPLLSDFEAEALQEAMTFEAVEQRVLSGLRDEVVAAAPGGWEALAAIVQRRQDGFWCQQHSGARAGSYMAAYQAVRAASELFQLRQAHDEGFSYPTAEAMYQAYLDELYGFDQAYRCFNELADGVEVHGWDVLKPLRERVEDCYGAWYMERLAHAWGALIAPEGHLRQPWRLQHVDRQQDFFTRHVAPQAANSRVYVIISDALRYEAAEELTRELNGKYRFQAALQSQLGVLPSYTALGMAALLPYRTLSYKLTPQAEVLVDGQPTVSLEQRKAILAKHQGVAIKAEDLIEMDRETGREFVKPYKVVYIYHDRIDALGDKSATESLAFQAVRQTIDELSGLVRKIINMLNGSHVIITADHGFLFQVGDPTPLEKSAIEEKPSGVLKPKKRFMLGTNLGEHNRVWHGETKDTAGAEGGMEFWLPKGINRFHFVGGARFIHGGAMPQEIAVPVITVKEKEGAAALKTSVRPVEVALLTAHPKVVNNFPRFELLQTEAVTERRPPRALVLSLRDKDNRPVSDEIRLTFDAVSDSLEDRKRAVSLKLLAGDYDKKAAYFLVLVDPKDGIEYNRYPLTIDLAFKNEF